jgi:chromosome segregation ATPase
MITQKNDEIMQLDSEISGLKTETRAEQNESEKLMGKLGALEKDVEMVKQAYQREEAEKKRLSEQFVLLQGSLNNTDAEMRNLALAEKEVQGKQAILAKSIMMLHGKTKAIRDDIINHASQ